MFMASVIIVGTQWGDEGKGKIVDYLANKAQYVVRSLIPKRLALSI